MDIAQLEERLREAVVTMANYRASPGPKEPQASWVEPVADFWAEYGRHGPSVRRPVPSPRELTRADEVQGWLTEFRKLPTPDEAERILLIRILWARAAQFSWQALADQLRAKGHKMSGKTVQRRHEVALACLLRIATRPQMAAA